MLLIGGVATMLWTKLIDETLVETDWCVIASNTMNLKVCKFIDVICCMCACVFKPPHCHKPSELKYTWLYWLYSHQILL